MAASKKATLSDMIAEKRVKKRTSIGNSIHTSYKGKNQVKKKYRGQGK